MVEEEFKINGDGGSGSSIRCKLIIVVLGIAIVAVGAYNFWPRQTEADIISVDIPLNGIVYAQQNPSAVIDQKIVHQGDTVDGVTVMSIGPAVVEFEKDGHTWTQEVKKVAVNADNGDG